MPILLLFIMCRLPPCLTLFPYTTLFRSRPSRIWLGFFALQGANRNLSAFSTARLDAARISRDPSEKSPCTTCIPTRSEEHTFELQSRFDLVCRLLFEK